MLAKIQQYLNALPDKRVVQHLSNAFGLFLPSGKDAALTAHAGGTKAAAYALNVDSSYHEVSTVATAADSILLPPGAWLCRPRPGQES